MSQKSLKQKQQQQQQQQQQQSLLTQFLKPAKSANLVDDDDNHPSDTQDRKEHDGNKSPEQVLSQQQQQQQKQIIIKPELDLAESLLSKFHSIPAASSCLPSPMTIIPLTPTGSSWIVHMPRFFPCPSRQIFTKMFQNHPSKYHELFVFGRKVYENRWSQLYVKGEGANNNKNNAKTTTYKYSGTSRTCITCDPQRNDEKFILALFQVTQELLETLRLRQRQRRHPENNNSIPQQKDDPFFMHSEKELNYNCCLVNWYKPEHSIGLHADDESDMDHLSHPIVSLSWGGPRRFLLRPKKPSTKQKDACSSGVHEVLLQDGDLFIMGGKCQDEFKHEIPKLRKKDGLVTDRISWTIRSLKKKKTSTTTTTTTTKHQQDHHANNNNNNNPNGKKRKR